jgi:altronate hydrolase
MTESNSEQGYLILNQKDSVAVALRELPAGYPLPAGGRVGDSAVPAGHKVALKPLAKGEPVFKYGQVIGLAGADIDAGEHVHVHNLVYEEFERGTGSGQWAEPITPLPQEKRATFEGYLRENGKAGTRNYLGVLASSNCASAVVDQIARSFTARDLEPYENVDGVLALTHFTGCGMMERVDDLEILHNVYSGYMNHPNFSGMVLVGLGCEVAQTDGVCGFMGACDSDTFRHFDIQKVGGSRKAFELGRSAILDMLPMANKAVRQTLGADKLVLGLECGGSDAYSGITANPALGLASDELIRNGGTAVLSETSEIYGAEHLLLGRAASAEVRDKVMDFVKWWEDYAAKMGGSINNNPSPGNKAGGLTTILEKSLGAVAKAGGSPLMEACAYGRPVHGPGLAFMDSPGYDISSITGKVAGGCNLVCFTTGRGSVFGGRPAPVIKLASNSAMYNRLSDDMDINCGEIVDGAMSLEDKGKQVFQTILEVASGKLAKGEKQGFALLDFQPWITGGSL